MGQTVRFQKTLRRLGLGLAAASAPDPKVLLQLGVPVAIGSPPVCLEWSCRGSAIEGGAG